MAACANITDALLTSIPSGSTPIPALFAFRAGYLALCDMLNRRCEQEVAASDVDHELEAAFSRANEELFDLDTRIMEADASSLDELRIQAAVCRHRTHDGDFVPEHVERLFASIERLAA